MKYKGIQTLIAALLIIVDEVLTWVGNRSRNEKQEKEKEHAS